MCTSPVIEVSKYITLGNWLIVLNNPCAMGIEHYVLQEQESGLEVSLSLAFVV